VISVTIVTDHIIIGKPAALWNTFDIPALPDLSCCYNLAARGILGEGDLEVTLKVKAPRSL
jgi:hypothetical protein